MTEVYKLCLRDGCQMPFTSHHRASLDPPSVWETSQHPQLWSEQTSHVGQHLEAPLGGFSGPQVESLWLQFGKCSPGPPKSRHWVPGYVPGEAPWGRQLRQQFASCPPQSHHTAPQWNASHTPLLKQISPLAGDDEPRRQALGGHVPTGPLPSPLQGHHVHCGLWSWWPWGCSFGDHVPSACRVGMHSSKILGLPPGWTWQSVGL